MVPYVPSVKTMLKGWLVLVLKNKSMLNSLFLLIVYIVKQCRKGRMVFPVTFITPKGIKYVVKKVDEWGIMDDLRLAGLMM